MYMWKHLFDPISIVPKNIFDNVMDHHCTIIERLEEKNSHLVRGNATTQRSPATAVLRLFTPTSVCVLQQERGIDQNHGSAEQSRNCPKKQKTLVSVSSYSFKK